MASWCGKTTRSGQSLVDILIGLTLIALTLGFATILVYGGEDMLIDREQTVSARALAEEGLHAARAILAENWASTADGNYGLSFANGAWQFSGTSTVTDRFTRSITVVTTSSDLREVRSVVTWMPSPARPRTVELTTLVSNASYVEETGGDTGGGSPFGDWRNPRTLGSVDLGPGNSATDLDVKQGIVYLGATASDKKKPDFFVVDATNGQNPTIRGSIDTGSGINAVDAAGAYVYAAHDAESGQFQVIHVANPSTPTLVASTTLPIREKARSVFYAADRVYVGTEAGDGEEFYVFDVANPASPQILGRYEVSATVGDIWVVGDRAYLATSANNRELLVLDVGNPNAITLAGAYDAAGTFDGQSVFAAGRLVYLGLAGGTQSFLILDAGALPAITLIGSADLGGAAVNDLYVSPPLAFLGTSSSNQEFQIWNIANASSPAFWSSYNFPQVATGVDYEQNLVYVSVRSNDALRIITSSP